MYRAVIFGQKIIESEFYNAILRGERNLEFLSTILEETFDNLELSKLQRVYSQQDLQTIFETNNFLINRQYSKL